LTRHWLFLCALPAIAQTMASPDQVPWQQVDWTLCGSPAHPGTQIRLWQIKAPPGALDLCWPQSLSVAAWSVINTRCTRCHGNGVIEENARIGIIQEPPTAYPPGRVDLVGDLDMRTKEAILKGGSRSNPECKVDPLRPGKCGPALKPRDPMGSLIYRFASRFQLGAGAGGNSTIPETQKFQLMDTLQGAGFRIVPPGSNEESIPMPCAFPLTGEELKALYDWIAAGAPSPL